MNHDEYFEYHEDICKRALEISKAKNSDYTGDNGNPFANLELVEAMGITSTEVGVLTRLSDKIARVNSFIKKGSYKVQDEKVEDTILDAINYLILLSAFMEKRALMRIAHP